MPALCLSHSRLGCSELSVVVGGPVLRRGTASLVEAMLPAVDGYARLGQRPGSVDVEARVAVARLEPSDVALRHCHGTKRKLTCPRPHSDIAPQANSGPLLLAMVSRRAYSLTHCSAGRSALQATVWRRGLVRNWIELLPAIVAREGARPWLRLWEAAPRGRSESPSPASAMAGGLPSSRGSPRDLRDPVRGQYRTL